MDDTLALCDNGADFSNVGNGLERVGVSFGHLPNDETNVGTIEQREDRACDGLDLHIVFVEVLSVEDPGVVPLDLEQTRSEGVVDVLLVCHVVCRNGNDDKERVHALVQLDHDRRSCGCKAIVLFHDDVLNHRKQRCSYLPFFFSNTL